jgi:uncharacterized protein (UPF0332 family)
LAKYEDHILQAERNLRFLGSINNSIQDCYDWQVTVCFYTALHFVNAHLSKFGLQYRKHKDVSYALNFANATSPAKLPEEEYIAYTALQSLSRRSRYLVNEKDNNLGSAQAFFTYDKHLAKALQHLNTLLVHFDVKTAGISVKCSEIKNGELKFFKKLT